MTLKRLLTVLGSFIWLMVVSQAVLIATAGRVEAQLACPNSSVTSHQIGRFAYHTIERNIGGAGPTCTSSVAIPTDGIRVFSSWMNCRDGNFLFTVESGGNGILPTSLDCPDCASRGQAFVTLSPGTSSSVTADFRFPDGATARYTATFSRSVASAQGRYTCSISNAQVTGGVFGSAPIEQSAVNHTVNRTVDRTVEETQEQITTYLGTRANNLSSNQTDMSCMLTGGCSGSFDADVTRGQLAFSLDTGREAPVWMSLTGSHVNNDTTEDAFYLATFGAHGHVSTNTLVGAMVQFDHQISENGDERIEGSGWMVGPYFVTKLPQHPLVFEGRALWGKTENKISPFDTYTDRFETERLLVNARVSGALGFDKFTLRPFASGTYIEDRQSAYRDDLGNRIDAQTVTLSQLALGIDLSMPFEMGRQDWVLDSGFSAIGSDLRGQSLGTPAFDDARGRVHAGISRSFDAGRFSLSGFYDGIGATAFEAYGLSMVLNVNF